MARKPTTRTKAATTKGSVCDQALVDAVTKTDDAAFVRQLVTWFRKNARRLPWRITPRRPWPSLVSELMAQQTQISRVLEKYPAFMDLFPTPRALADACEDDVLAAWSGLGYYRRARLLQQAAREIAKSFDGEVPSRLADLRSLPGVGRYTAGAVASIVFGEPAPIVDGNVARVLLRVSAKRSTAADASDWAWEQAERLAAAAGPDVAEFNEGLMELGALVCTPKRPRCDACPLAAMCKAKSQCKQEQIPLPKPQASRSVIRADVVVVSDHKGRVLVEQRPATGLWASMWQAPTRETHDAAADTPGPLFGSRDLASLLDTLRLPDLDAMGPEEFTHQTTHRRVEFRVWRAKSRVFAASEDRRWVTKAELAKLALSNPQRNMLLGKPARTLRS